MKAPLTAESEHFRLTEDFDPEERVTLRMGDVADLLGAVFSVYDDVPHVAGISLVGGGARVRNTLGAALVRFMEALPRSEDSNSTDGGVS